MDDKLLMSGLKQKERKAFNLLFDLLYPQLQFFTEQITNNPAEAEDIAVQALVKFWEKDPRHFESLLQVRKFIFTIARNAAFDYLKRVKVQQAHQKKLTYISNAVEEQTEDQAFYKLEMMMQALHDQLDQLPAQCREVFRLVFIEHLPRPEVAQQLNISPGTVNVHCAQAIKRLRKIFSEKEWVLLYVLAVLSNN